MAHNQTHINHKLCVRSGMFNTFNKINADKIILVLFWRALKRTVNFLDISLIMWFNVIYNTYVKYNYVIINTLINFRFKFKLYVGFKN